MDSIFGQFNGANSPLKHNFEPTLLNQSMGRNSFVSNLQGFKPGSFSQFHESRDPFAEPVKRNSSFVCYPSGSLDQTENSFDFDDLEDMDLNDFNDFYESGEGSKVTRYECIERPQNPFYKNFESYQSTL
jgi:hypothetical protein